MGEKRREIPRQVVMARPAPQLGRDRTGGVEGSALRPRRARPEVCRRCWARGVPGGRGGGRH